MSGYGIELTLGAITMILAGIALGLTLALSVVKRKRHGGEEQGAREEAVNLRLEAERTRLESEKTRRETGEMSRQIAQLRLDSMRRRRT